MNELLAGNLVVQKNLDRANEINLRLSIAGPTLPLIVVS